MRISSHRLYTGLSAARVWGSWTFTVCSLANWGKTHALDMFTSNFYFGGKGLDGLGISFSAHAANGQSAKRQNWSPSGNSWRGAGYELGTSRRVVAK